MSTFHFIRLQQFEYTLKLYEHLLQDQEDVVHEAVGWMMGEVGNRDVSVENYFLQPYYKIIPRTMHATCD